MKRRLSVAAALTLLLGFSSVSVSATERYGRELCQTDAYHCMEVGQGDTWQSLFPDPKDREIVQRLNRTNQPVSHRNWVAVPHGLETVDYVSLSPLPQTYNTDDQRLLLVDISDMAFGADGRDGNLLHWGPISAGKGCHGRHCNTPTGQYSIRTQMPVTHESSIYPLETNGGAPMPYAMHYLRGFALHGSPTVPGYHASHGCIRLFNEDAKWLNQQFTEVGTRIVVQD